MKRTLWELAVVVVFLAALAGLWRWSEIKAESAVGRQVQAQQEERGRLQRSYHAWVDQLAVSEAEAVTRAFAAGIQPAVLARRAEALLEAKHQLLKMSRISFVHVLAVDGTVLMSSDEKYSTVGQADERAEWALSAQELSRRDSNLEGITELAAPLGSSSGLEAVLWIGYKTGPLKRETRPEGLNSGPPIDLG